MEECEEDGDGTLWSGVSVRWFTVSGFRPWPMQNFTWRYNVIPQCKVRANGYHLQLGAFGSTVEERVALVTPESSHVPFTPPHSPGMEVSSPGQESLHHGQVTGPGGQVEGGVSPGSRKRFHSWILGKLVLQLTLDTNELYGEPTNWVSLRWRCKLCFSKLQASLGVVAGCWCIVR